MTTSAEDGAERHEQRARADSGGTAARARAVRAEAEQPAARQRRELDQEQERERHAERQAQPVAALEPEIDRRQDQQRHDEHDAEVVRVGRQRVRPIDARSVDRAVDVDRARAAGQRREHDRVEAARPARRGSWRTP